MSLTSGNCLGGKLPNATSKTYICTRRDESTDDWQETATSCECQRGIERVILVMNVRVSLGSE